MKKIPTHAADRSLDRPLVDETYELVGARLRDRRKAMRMTQSDLGRVAGISFQQVQKYERGANRVAIDKLQQFAAALKVPVSFFLPSSPAPAGLASGNKQTAFNSPPSKQSLELLSAFSKLQNPAHKKQVLALIKKLASANKHNNPSAKAAPKAAAKTGVKKSKK